METIIAVSQHTTPKYRSTARLILAISVQIQELENDPTSSRRAQYLANRYLAQAKTSGVGLRHRTVRHKIAVSHQNPVKERDEHLRTRLIDL